MCVSLCEAFAHTHTHETPTHTRNTHARNTQRREEGGRGTGERRERDDILTKSSLIHVHEHERGVHTVPCASAEIRASRALAMLFNVLISNNQKEIIMVYLKPPLQDEWFENLADIFSSRFFCFRPLLRSNPRAVSWARYLANFPHSPRTHPALSALPELIPHFPHLPH